MVAEPLHRLVAQPGREPQGGHGLAPLEGIAGGFGFDVCWMCVIGNLGLVWDA
jgi:hypothetical protein